MGPVTRELEAALAQACGRKHAVVVASGLSALRVTLLAAGIKTGERVGVPAYSCVALPNAVLSIGAVPVAIDNATSSVNLDCNSVARFEGLNAVIGVGTFGVPFDPAALKSTSIPVIEDCSHGFGLGSLGRQGIASVASLHATKFLGAGRGGAVMTDDAALAERLHDLRDYDDKPASARALNEKPDDLNSALALNRLRRLKDIVARRAALAARYNRELSKRITLPAANPDRIWYRYDVRADDALRWCAELQEKGIGAEIPVTDWLSDKERAECPAAREAYKSILSLPMFPGLTEAEQSAVISAVNELAEKKK